MEVKLNEISTEMLISEFTIAMLSLMAVQLMVEQSQHKYLKAISDS